MHPEHPQGLRQGGQRVSGGPAVEDHGRAVTTNAKAAAFYRQAQQAVNAAQTVTALRLAVDADPTFALAATDLDALTETPPTSPKGHQMNWERHHIEVVRTAADGNIRRATDLLREHLASVGCDPLARRIVTHLQDRKENRSESDDLGRPLPGCHPTW